MTSVPTKPRLLFVLPASSFGGAERVVFNLILGMQAFECSLLTQRAIGAAFEPLRVQITYFDDYGCKSPYNLTLVNSLRYALCVWRVTRLENPDCIKAMMHNGTFYCALTRCWLRLRTPMIGSIHGNISGYFKSIGRDPNWWERLIIRTVVTVPDGLITPSQGVADDLMLNYSAAPARLEAIPNGIDVERIRGLANLSIVGWIKDRPWIVSACRMAPQKDFQTLLRAFDRVRQATQAKLILVGDGEIRDEVERIIKKLNLQDDVVMTGFQTNPYSFLRVAEISVLSSFYEGSPVSIIEAFVLGLPQVVTDCPSGPSELIQDGVSGYLVPVGSVEIMAERMLLLLEDEALRCSMSKAAKQRAEFFGLTEMVSHYEHYLQKFGPSVRDSPLDHQGGS